VNNEVDDKLELSDVNPKRRRRFALPAHSKNEIALLSTEADRSAISILMNHRSDS